MRVYVLTRIDKTVVGVDENEVDERTVVGVYSTRQDATYFGAIWRHQGADDYDIEEFDL